MCGSNTAAQGESKRGNTRRAVAGRWAQALAGQPGRGDPRSVLTQTQKLQRWLDRGWQVLLTLNYILYHAHFKKQPTQHVVAAQTSFFNICAMYQIFPIKFSSLSPSDIFLHIWKILIFQEQLENQSNFYRFHQQSYSVTKNLETQRISHSWSTLWHSFKGYIAQLKSENESLKEKESDMSNRQQN